MIEILKNIQERHSSRVPFDQEHPPAKHDLLLILEAARWAPTAHNMQNFEIIVVEDKNQLDKLGNIKFRISEDFLKENYQQLSFSEEELIQKKVGILGTMFPPSWRTPDDWIKVAHEGEPAPLNQTIQGSPTLLIVTYDAGKRAPGLVSVSAREKIFLGQIPLILSDVHSIKLGGVAGLYLDLLSHFSAGEDPLALEGAEDCLEAALLDLIPVRQAALTLLSPL
jgi:nitroreductase